MDAQDQIKWIEARKRKLADECERLEQEIDDLNAALKVIYQIEMETRQEPTPPKSEVAAETKKPESTGSKLGPPRPENIPTNFEMVEAILLGAEKDGGDGLSISELISGIRDRYWPGLEDVQVSAPIYAFVRKGRLTKTSAGKFRRIANSPAEHEISSGKPREGLMGKIMQNLDRMTSENE